MKRAGCLNVVAGILEDVSGILIARRSCAEHPGEWEFPGGKIEPGESATEAIRRELREELGILIENPRLVGSILHDYPHVQVDIRFFSIISWQGDVCAQQKQAIRWVAPDNLDASTLAAADQRFWCSEARFRYL